MKYMFQSHTDGGVLCYLCACVRACTRVCVGHKLWHYFFEELTSQLKDKDKNKDLFIGPQEFVVGYSKAPEQPQSSARPICHSHAMTRTGRELATICIAA